MAIRSTPSRRVARLATNAVAHSRALFGESLPELLLVTAVVAGVALTLVAG